MNSLVKILKGTIIGVGAILPGISGGVIAAAFNIYKELVEALNSFLKHPLKSVIAVWQYLVGIISGVILGYILIVTLYKMFPLPITFLFIGLILGELPAMVVDLKNVPIKPSYIITMVISIAVMILVIFLPEISYDIDGFMLYVIYFSIGFLMALSFIVPGLSGTMLLMALGFYSFFIGIGDSAKSALISGDFKSLFSYAPQFLVILLGLIIGMLILVKPIHYALKKKETHFNYAVLGIILISPANIMLSLWKENEIDILKDPSIPYIFDAEWWVYLIGGVLLVIGFIISYIFMKKRETNKLEAEEVKGD